ncbi:MAG: hypothetical protein JNK40_06730 [Chromatiales bacterium]|nr:hypothetical protein [Chromatiales bacterium]
MLALAQQLLARRKPVDDDRLLRLFWNRAELKREFARVQRERERMVDQIRQQEGALLRAQQRLDQLEGLLADPDRAATAAVYFQLRGVWAYGRRRLGRLARDLSTRQQEREGQREAARFEEHRLAALHAIEQRLQPLQERRALLEGELTAVRARRFERTGFWNYFARRRLDGEQGVLVAAQQSVDEQIGRYERARHEKLKEEAPLPDTLGVEGKRLVNLSVIALAQELVLAFGEHDVAALARDASLRQVTEVGYGSLQACRELSRRVDGVLRRVEGMDELAGRMRRRAEFLRQSVGYRRDSDTVPAADTLAVIPAALTGDGDPRPAGGRELAVNVLADEYWDVYGVLLH